MRPEVETRRHEATKQQREMGRTIFVLAPLWLRGCGCARASRAHVRAPARGPTCMRPEVETRSHEATKIGKGRNRGEATLIEELRASGSELRGFVASCSIAPVRDRAHVAAYRTSNERAVRASRASGTRTPRERTRAKRARNLCSAPLRLCVWKQARRVKCATRSGRESQRSMVRRDERSVARTSASRASGSYAPCWRRPGYRGRSRTWCRRADRSGGSARRTGTGRRTRCRSRSRRSDS